MSKGHAVLLGVLIGMALLGILSGLPVDEASRETVVFKSALK